MERGCLLTITLKTRLANFCNNFCNNCFFQLVFAWEAYEKGADVHLQADPTKLELLHKEYRVKKGDFEQDKKLSILDKVGIQTLLKQKPYSRS